MHNATVRREKITASVWLQWLAGVSDTTDVDDHLVLPLSGTYSRNDILVDANYHSKT